MDAFYLPLYLYCEFVDLTPSTVRARQFGIYYNAEAEQTGVSILELVRSKYACILYVYASDELFLEGDWFVVFEAINFGPHDGVYLGRPRFNNKSFESVTAPAEFEHELTKMLDWFGDLKREVEAG